MLKLLLSFGTVRYSRYLDYLESYLPLSKEELSSLSREELYKLLEEHNLVHTIYFTDY